MDPEIAIPMTNGEVPKTPKFVTILLLVSVGLSVLLLALCAYAISVYSNLWFDVITPALSFMLFSCIWLWLFAAAYFLVPRYLPRFYNRWAVLAMMCLTVLFWLISFALLASRVADESYLNSYENYLDNFNIGVVKRSPKKSHSSGSSSGSSDSSDSSDSSIFGSSGTTSYHYNNNFSTAWKVAAAAAGIGALTWLLLVVCLVYYGIGCWSLMASGAEASEGEEKPMPPAAPVAAGHDMNQ